MFPSARDILKKREGSLGDVPFPVLLNAVYMEDATCAIELTHHQLEKRVLFEEGVPVGCNSNLLHESLGKYLVERGKLSESDYQQSLAESVQTGSQLGDVLIRKQLISGYELYKQMQANLAHKILDCFRWSDGRYRILMDVAPVPSPVRMNAAQLILTGTANFLPFDMVATHFTFVDEQRFASVPKPPYDLQALKLSAKDVRFLQALKARPTFSELAAKTSAETEPLMRRLFAFIVLGAVAYAEQVDAAISAPAETPVPAPKPEIVAPAASAAPKPAPGISLSDDDEGLRNELTTLFLESRGKDALALLGLEESAQPAQLKKAFLSLADKFSPVRFATPDLKDKAEALLISFARAYAEVANPESLAQLKSRREAERGKKLKGTPQAAAEQFKIKTTLLDASKQFNEGLARLKDLNFKAALQQFEYACDIDNRPVHRAHRAWAMFNVDPTRFEERATDALMEIGEEAPATHEAFFFLGEILKRRQDWAGAEDAYRKAQKAKPGERRYSDAFAAASKARGAR